MFTAAELESIADVVRDFPNLIVLSDEVYEYIKFDGH
jgi:aspartate/methionine/tyrosine aminotransferase